ncbi:glucose 1-dehydrogenase [Bacillaceae bacterium S4-13-58]
MYLPSFRLDGKLAAITGATKGIGKALALGYAEAGADVILIARQKEGLREVKTEIEKIGSKAYVIQSDVKDYESIINEVDHICANEKSIDIWVNNAGMNIRTPALDVTEEEWERIVTTNMKSAFFLSQAAAKRMSKNGHGKIISVSSVAGHVALRTGVVYGMTKAGIIQMTKTLALEWGKYGIHVNAIGPWYFPTSLTEELLQNEQYVKEICDRTPLGRIGELKELVGAGVFLATEASNYITGQTLFVDGGMTIYGF